MTTDRALPADPAARLAAAARAIAGGPEPDAGLDTILGLAIADRAADVAVLASLDDDRTRLHYLRGLGVHPDDIAAIEGTGADPADPLTVASGERRPVASPAPGEPAPAGALALRLGLARVEARPLVVGRGGIDHAVGVILLGWRPGTAASDGTPGFLDALVDLAAVALDRTRQAASQVERSEWFERLAHLDPLTGLANRRTLDRMLELEIARASRQGSDVSVAVFDVDAFRETNEAGGATAGDDVLRAVAAVLAESVRLVDTVARIGGDEFVVVAPGAGGVTVANRVIAGLTSLDQVAGQPVSVSAGVARFPVDGTTGGELLERALLALDGARAAGRGSVAEASPAAASTGQD